MRPLRLELEGFTAFRDPQVVDAAYADLVSLFARDRVLDVLEVRGAVRVGGVGFLDVDHQELHLVAVLLVELGQPTG